MAIDHVRDDISVRNDLNLIPVADFEVTCQNLGILNGGDQLRLASLGRFASGRLKRPTDGSVRCRHVQSF
jgi:hypothetical protein